MGEHLLLKYYHNEILESDNHVHLNILYGLLCMDFLFIIFEALYDTFTLNFFKELKKKKLYAYFLRILPKKEIYV